MEKKRVTVEMSPKLYKKLSNNAWAARMNISEYLRSLIEQNSIEIPKQKK